MHAAQLEPASKPAPLEQPMRPRKVLVLHQHYWPEIAATAQILTDICEDLATAGHQVSVICGQPSYRVLGQQTALPRYEEHRGVKIHRVWSYVPSERTIPKRLVHYGSYFASSLLSALQCETPDVCFVMSTPPLLLGLSGMLLDTFKRVPFIYSVQDLYPDIAIHLGVIKAGSAAAAAIEQVTRTCYRSAAALVTLSPGMATRLVDKGVPNDRVHVIPNWADTSAITPVARDNEFARTHGLADRFVVQYSGNLGLSQGLGALIAAARELRDLPIRIALVGDGNARAGLAEAVRSQGLDNVVFLPPQPRAQLSELLGACDIGLVTMKADVGSDLVPSKLYGIMAAGRPVLASVAAGSEVDRVVREHDCGWVVAPESASALAQGIRTAFEASSADRTSKGERGRAACATEYTRTPLTHQYARLMDRVASSRA